MRKVLLSFVLVLATLLSAQERELRGIWVTTAWGGIDWPTTKIETTGNATQIAAQQSELITILDNAKKANLNTIFFQVRGHGDALYTSSYEPWSNALSGTRGKAPGYDPLKFAIEEAHKRGLELHAWVNPYRMGNSPRPARVKESWVLPAGILDPGNPDVRQYTMDVIGEIIDKYDIDGLVFDDYFYKSMKSNEYATNETHQNSSNNPHNLSIDDWRRENVNILISSVMNYVKEHKPYVRFGVAPFGIWSTSNHAVYDENYINSELISPASGINGQDAYSVLYCDAAAWLKRGYIDYISPQLYWPSLSESESYLKGTDYGVLCKWWSDLAKRYNRPLITSNDIAKNKENWQGKIRFNTPQEISNQININREGNKSLGNVFYNTTYFQNRGGANTHFKRGDGYFNYLPENHYQHLSIQPAITWRTAPAAPAISNIDLDKNNNILTWTSSGNNVKYAVYSYPNNITKDTGCTSDNLVGITYTNEFNTIKFTSKYEQKWAVRVLDRYGNLYDPIEYPTDKPVEKTYLLGLNDLGKSAENEMTENNGIFTKTVSLQQGKYSVVISKGSAKFGYSNIDNQNSTQGYTQGAENKIDFELSKADEITFSLSNDIVTIKAKTLDKFGPKDEPVVPPVDPTEPSNENGEFRGLWICTFLNKDWPTTKNNAEVQKQELINILDKAKQGNLNSIMFQVRYWCDALYESKIGEPWSECLTGTRGKNPGYDPLKFAIEEAHKRGLELHAYMSPCRIGSKSANSEYIKSNCTLGSGYHACLDPGNTDVQRYILDVAKEVIDNYNIDGLIFDDYFYFQNLKDNTETEGNTRRNNVTKIIKSVKDYIDQEKPYLRFGLTQWGIQKSANGISGTQAYYSKHIDTEVLLKNKYIDYIAPQLIWPIGSVGTDYSNLCKWWSDLTQKNSRHLFTNNDVFDQKKHTQVDISNQLGINRTNNANGSIFSRSTGFINEGYDTYLPNHEFTTKSLWPAMTWKSEPASFTINNLNIDAANDVITWECNNKDARFAIYCYPVGQKETEGCVNENLIGVTYNSSFRLSDMPEEYGSSLGMTICPIDRYGNRYFVNNIPVENQVMNRKDYLIYSNGNNLCIELDNEMHNVTIYSVLGEIVYNNLTNNNLNLILQDNIYIIRIDEQSYKVIIK